MGSALSMTVTIHSFDQHVVHSVSLPGPVCWGRGHKNHHQCPQETWWTL